ncbi:hypothetical protein OPHB3_3242 [Oceanobacillus picturae]|uniref:Uncharacterized protein n=1 Tax=Oceanobacillus picturae TaxID=171693 RepID=A0A0U9HB45_9BACI|nr:hypothetical protein [Oceanobacillus picturae]GAQ19280.1 hypothetical protein OPHB3_3242 [Oceanobacillus picturae]
MGFFRVAGKGAGSLFGTVVGGSIKFAGDLTGSKFIEEVGDGVKSASKFAGDSVGQAADGVWNTASGMIQKDDDKINRGVDDLGSSVGRTAKGIGTTIKNTAEQSYNAYDGFKSGDTQRAKESLKGIGKTAAIGMLAVGVVDIADGIEGSESSATQVSSGETAPQMTSEESSSINTQYHNVDAHYVEGYTRTDGTYVEGYWRDGDGDTSVNRTVEEGGGYIRSNPDGNFTSNID